MEKSKGSSGLTLDIVLFAVFLILRLANVSGPWITGTHWWDGWTFVIFAPIAIGLAWVAFWLIIGLACLGVAYLLEKKR